MDTSRDTSEIVDSDGIDRSWAEYSWLRAASVDISRFLLRSGSARHQLSFPARRHTKSVHHSSATHSA